MDGKEINQSAQRRTPARGVNCLFFGSVLLFTGLLNSLVSLKAEMTTGRYNYIMLIAGAALLLAGRLRRRKITCDAHCGR